MFGSVLEGHSLLPAEPRQAGKRKVVQVAREEELLPTGYEELLTASGK